MATEKYMQDVELDSEVRIPLPLVIELSVLFMCGLQGTDSNTARQHQCS